MSMDKPTEAPGFTIAELWDRLGITAESQMGERVHANTQSDDPDVEIAAAVDAWEARAKEQTTSEGLTEVWKDAKAKNVPVEVLDAIRKIAADFQETITGEGKELKKGTRLWLREARAMTAQADVQALFSEAKALGVDESILVQLADMAASLPGAAPAVADEPWAPVDEPPADEDSEGPAAALEDAAVQS
jgi:hypothetical protein